MNEGHDTTYGNSAIGRPDDKNAPAPPEPCPYCGGKVAHTDKCPLVTADPGPEEAAESTPPASRESLIRTAMANQDAAFEARQDMRPRSAASDLCTICSHVREVHQVAGCGLPEPCRCPGFLFCACGHEAYTHKVTRRGKMQGRLDVQCLAACAKCTCNGPHPVPRQKPDFAETYGRAAYERAHAQCAACGHVSALHAPNGGRCTGKYCPCKAYLPFGTGLQPPVEVAHMGSHRGIDGECLQAKTGTHKDQWCNCAKYEPDLPPPEASPEHSSVPAIDELWAITPTEHLSQDLRAAQRHLRATYSADQVTALRVAAYLIDLGWQPPQGTTA